MELKRDLRPLYRAKMVVAVGGPPHSGKSVFLAELYRQLLAKAPKSNYVFLQRMCPDGEGVWSAEAHPEVVAEIRRKGKFAQGFLDRHLPMLVGPALVGSFRIILADLGGVRSAENAEILRHSTHLITLSSDPGQTLLWEEFSQGEGCAPLARFTSGLLMCADKSVPQQVRSFVNFPSGQKNLVSGLLLQLHREAGSEPYEEAISQFADWMIAQVERR